MRVTDLLGLSFSSLRQHKVRTVLTTLGVVFGSLVLTATLSIGQGVQRAIRALTGDEALRRVEVWPDWGGRMSDGQGEDALQVEGEMSESRRERIRDALARRQVRSSDQPRAPLSRTNIAKLRTLVHVETVVPMVWQDGYAVLDGRSETTDIGAARPDDVMLQRRLVAGRLFDAANEPSIVVSEALLYLLGVTDESAVHDVLGRKMRIELRVRQRPGLSVHINHPVGGRTNRPEAAIIERITNQLPQIIDKLDLSEAEKAFLRAVVASQPADATSLRGREFTIIGVTRAPQDQERWPRRNPFLIDGDVVLPFETAAELYFHLQGSGETSMHRAVLIVDREEHVESVLAAARELGFEGYAAVEHLKRGRLMYLLIFGAMTFVAVVSLLVAALGIANTMLISVLQRRREIGIMKAVGADSRHLQFIFLVEGALIGCVGGGLGLLSAWGASFPADAWIQSMASRELKIELEESICVFPAWLPVTVVCFAVAVTVLAAVYPSRRAARVDPVAALRHE